MKGFCIVLGPPLLIVDLLVSALLGLFLFDLSAILGVHPATQISGKANNGSILSRRRLRVVLSGCD